MRRFRLFIKTFLICLLCAAIIGIAGYFTILSIFPFPYDKISNIHYSKIIYDRDGNMLRAFTGQNDLWLMPVELAELNPDFINATLAIEDKRFFKHRGIDITAVLRAIKLNLANKKIMSGASTISMQVIRLLEGRKRTILNKIIEAVHAVHLELLYPKEKILALYFEIAPYGGNIHGVKAASLRYFKKHPKDLNLSECALLAGLPQSPSRLRPDRYPERAKERRNRVLFNMAKNGFITEMQYKKAIEEPVLAANYSFPFKAPHFSRFIKNKFKKDSCLITTLDSNIQHFAQIVLEEKINELKPHGVTNGAIVVIENRTGALRALIGSVDFFSEENSGQINGALSRRCPGSTLKPFTYALAFEKGFYTPRMILADVPVQYAGYEPLDYDREYRGPVTVREALIDSLNVPAVEVLDKINYRNLYYLLENAGITSLNKAPEYYGLSLTLGSCEVRLLELTNAYAMLARLGVYKPIQYRENTKLNISKRLLSEAASYLVAEILSDSKRLEALGIYRDDKTYPRFAWKTGTSYDHKDAWTICYNPEYTVGVWIGNFSGKSSNALVGIEAAAPVAIKIFDWLYANKPGPWYEMPEGIGVRYVCALSGEPVSEICPHAVKDFYIKGRSVSRVCSVHKKIAIDKETGLALNKDMLKDRDYEERIFEVWPSALNSWFKQNSSHYAELPKYLTPDKKIIDFDKDKPRIISPTSGCEYFTAGIQGEPPMLQLIGQGMYDTEYLFWFIDGKYFDKTLVGEKIFWMMTKGHHKITCSDNYGRSSTVTIVVR